MCYSHALHPRALYVCERFCLFLLFVRAEFRGQPVPADRYPTARTAPPTPTSETTDDDGTHERAMQTMARGMGELAVRVYHLGSRGLPLVWVQKQRREKNKNTNFNRNGVATRTRAKISLLLHAASSYPPVAIAAEIESISIPVRALCSG
jgi:hypothetical protein